MNKWIKGSLYAGILAAIATTGYALYIGYAPVAAKRLDLAPPLVAIDTEEGRQRLENANAADFRQIEPYFEAQQQRNTCGIATAVSVINASRQSKVISQDDFLKTRVPAVKLELVARVTGLTLSEMGRVLKEDSKNVDVHFAAEENMEGFKADFINALHDPAVVVIVNYSREKLHQVGAGHIAPIGAYEPSTDSVLVMDVAHYKYPATWVPVQQLFDSMTIDDPASGKSRGWLEVTL
jgi:hypothetical protein